MKIGVTGTRTGMTPAQAISVTDILSVFGGSDNELHHGDCVGVDVEVAKIAEWFGYRTICHPPIKDDLRAHHASAETREPLSYFARNRKIVDETDILLVVPYQMEHQTHGGTWYTHDYALKKKRTVTTILPDGSVTTVAGG